MSTTRHVIPVDDLTTHTDDGLDDGGCICGSRIEPVKLEDGSVGWVIVHNSLDGREQAEN